MFFPLTGELEEWRPASLCSVAQRNSGSVSFPCGIMALLIRQTLWFLRAASCSPIQCRPCQWDERLCRLHWQIWIFYLVMPSISFQTELGRRPAVLRSFCFCPSLSDKATAIHYWAREQPPVFWLCVSTVQYTQKHNTLDRARVYCVPLTKCQPVNRIAENIPSVCHYCSVFFVALV